MDTFFNAVLHKMIALVIVTSEDFVIRLILLLLFGISWRKCFEFVLLSYNFAFQIFSIYFILLNQIHPLIFFKVWSGRIDLANIVVSLLSSSFLFPYIL